MSARPMLAEVLAALTCDELLSAELLATLLAQHLVADDRLRPGLVLTDRDVTAVHRVPGLPVRNFMAPQPWTCGTPAEAVEALIARDLLPPQWGDAARAPRWWCDACGGSGLGDVDPEQGLRYGCACDSGHTAAPPSLAALVAVASLGIDTLARVEAIVAETWPGRALVFRVLDAETLRKHHRGVGLAQTALDVTTAFSRESVAEAYLAGRKSHVAEPWDAPLDGDAPAVVAAWYALCALRGLNMHLIACVDGRVTIGVEAL